MSTVPSLYNGCMYSNLLRTFVFSVFYYCIIRTACQVVGVSASDLGSANKPCASVLGTEIGLEPPQSCESFDSVIALYMSPLLHSHYLSCCLNGVNREQAFGQAVVRQWSMSWFFRR